MTLGGRHHMNAGPRSTMLAGMIGQDMTASGSNTKIPGGMEGKMVEFTSFSFGSLKQRFTCDPFRQAGISRLFADTLDIVITTEGLVELEQRMM